MTHIDSFADQQDGRPIVRASHHHKLLASIPFGEGFVDRMVALINSARHGAHVSVVVHEGFLYRRDYRSLRERLIRTCRLTAVARLPEDAFGADANVRAHIVSFEPGITSSISFGDATVDVFAQLGSAIILTEQGTLERRILSSQGYTRLADDLGTDLALTVDGPWRCNDGSAQLAGSPRSGGFLSNFSHIQLGESESIAITKILQRKQRPIQLDDSFQYKQLSIHPLGGGAFLRATPLGADIKTKCQHYVREGDLVVSRLDARVGGLALVPRELDGAIISQEYWCFKVHTLSAEVALWGLLSDDNLRAMRDMSYGTTGRVRMKISAFLGLRISVPQNDDVQAELRRIVRRLYGLDPV